MSVTLLWRRKCTARLTGRRPAMSTRPLTVSRPDAGARLDLEDRRTGGGPNAWDGRALVAIATLHDPLHRDHQSHYLPSHRVGCVENGVYHPLVRLKRFGVVALRLGFGVLARQFDGLFTVHCSLQRVKQVSGSPAQPHCLRIKHAPSSAW